MSYIEQKLYTEADFQETIQKIMQENQVERYFLVCGRNSYHALELDSILAKIPVSYTHFSGFSSNPVYEEAVAGTELFNSKPHGMILAIGGGSAIDIAKCIRLFSALNPKKNYLKQKYISVDIPLIVTPTTAGTGSESTHFAVLYENGEKRSVCHKSMLPDAVVLEPGFLKSLNEYQKKSAMLDALCQCIESYWSVNSTEESKKYAHAGMRLILGNMLNYLEGESEAARNMLVGANYSGKAINISQTTAAHAMSYKLSSMYGIAHGHAVACCLPAVWRWIGENASKCTDPRGEAYLLGVLDELNEIFYVDTAEQAVRRFEQILKSLEISIPPKMTNADTALLSESVNQQRLGNTPVQLEQKEIQGLYASLLERKKQDFFQDNFLEKYRLVREISQLQIYALELLNVVDKFCHEHEIPYYLGEGSMLGAVRHHGFIPWDDDIDLLMERQYYDKFIALAVKDFPDGYALDCMETNPRHWTICAKIQITRNTPFLQKKVQGIGLYAGPNIDIFPLDQVPRESSVVQTCQGFIVDVLKVMLWIKTGYTTKISGWKRRLLAVASNFFSIQAIQGLIDKVMRYYNGKSYNYLVNYGSMYSVKKETFRKDFYGTPREISFEKKLSYIPQKAEDMLKKIYGDYNTLPPYKKRFPKHSFIRIGGN